MTSIGGVVPIIPVPFHEDESIDESSLQRLVDYVCSQKMAAMCLPAYGSEFYKLCESERERVVDVAIATNNRRIPLIAQANHGAATIAAGLAKRYQTMGADVISFALPRQFMTTEADLLDYASKIANAVSIPVLIQDFNPGGVTIDVDFIAELHHRCPNFRYVKLEEPLFIDKLTRIRDQMGDQVGILEGWGGYYMLEAIPAGICGIMPGVPIANLLKLVYDARKQGEDQRAYDLFGALLPFINFTLQDFELFLQVEKRLLVRRGLITNATCRSLTFSPSGTVQRHIDYLIEQVMRVMEHDRFAALA